MKYKFDIQKDGGVDPVDWSKINLPRSGPTRYPSEPQPDRQEQCLEQYRNGDPKPLKDYLDELKAQVGFVPDESPNIATPKEVWQQEVELTPYEVHLIEHATAYVPNAQTPMPQPRLQEPVGPTAKFNPTTKAWEMPDEPGKSDAVA